VELLGEGHGRVVVGQLAGQGAVPARERDAVVDVEDAVAAAGRPDGGGCLDAVLLGVDLAVLEGAAAFEGGAGGLLLKVSARSPCTYCVDGMMGDSRSCWRPARSSTS
jgi:hypothetical protein